MRRAAGSPGASVYRERSQIGAFASTRHDGPQTSGTDAAAATDAPTVGGAQLSDRLVVPRDEDGVATLGLRNNTR
jgi:hypothetical protein